LSRKAATQCVSTALFSLRSVFESGKYDVTTFYPIGAVTHYIGLRS